MRIALTVDPELPVPPKHYGGIERIVAMLAERLTSLGHEVTLFANPESSASCALVPYSGKSSYSLFDTFANMNLVRREVAKRSIQVVHSFGRLAYLLRILPDSVPKLMSYQRSIPRESVIWGHKLSKGTLRFSAVGHHLIKGLEGYAQWHVVPNGVPMKKFTLASAVAADAPVVFLGRVEEIKGPHLAIEIAKRSGRRLILAGNISPGEKHAEFFRREIEPAIDGRRVTYIGPVDDVQKNDLLRRAAALLMPVLWEEPFGIVMAEALACGTPVLGLRRGAVPEVVQDGVTGFVRDGCEELAATVPMLNTLDRGACRRVAEERFSDGAVTSQYLSIYSQMVAATAVGSRA